MLMMLRREWMVEWSRRHDLSVQDYERRIANSAAYHDSLATLPAARMNKFQNRNALPFRGYSLVQWLPSGELREGLTVLSACLQDDFAQLGIDGWFSFLPSTTFHATVRDLLLGTVENEEQYMQSVRTAAKQIESRHQLAPEMQVEGVSFMGESSLAIMLHPIDREGLATIVEIRQTIAGQLERDGQPFTRLDAGDFFGHITLSYPGGVLPTEVYRAAQKAARARSEKVGVAGWLTFDNLELRRFESMVEWSEPLLTL